MTTPAQYENAVKQLRRALPDVGVAVPVQVAHLGQLLDALPRWTREQPTREGWYWFRLGGDALDQVVFLCPTRLQASTDHRLHVAAFDDGGYIVDYTPLAFFADQQPQFAGPLFSPL